jgi:hypothetical protein
MGDIAELNLLSTETTRIETGWDMFDTFGGLRRNAVIEVGSMSALAFENALLIGAELSFLSVLGLELNGWSPMVIDFDYVGEEYYKRIIRFSALRSAFPEGAEQIRKYMEPDTNGIIVVSTNSMTSEQMTLLSHQLPLSCPTVILSARRDSPTGASTSSSALLSSNADTRIFVGNPNSNSVTVCNDLGFKFSFELDISDGVLHKRQTTRKSLKRRAGLMETLGMEQNGIRDPKYRRQLIRRLCSA